MNDGDTSMCADCGKWSVVDQGALRLPTDDEAAFIDRDPIYRKISRTWLEMKLARKGL
jgi:hypothetical protein